MNKQIAVYIFLVLIIVGGGFIRLYRSYDKLRFLNDEAGIMNSLQIIHRGLITLDLSILPLKGPDAETFFPEYNSLLHHGAPFFYLIFLPALITNFHPYGSVFFIILLNTIAIYLIYRCGENLFGRIGGLISAFLLSTSFLANFYSRWIWNPNLIVFFVTLTLLSFLKIIQGNRKYWPIFAFAAAATTQMHILGYIFIFTTFIPMVFFVKYPKGKLMFLTGFFFLLPLIPEILYEISTGFQFSANISSLLYKHSVDYLDYSMLGSLMKIALLAILGLKVELFYLFFFLLTLGIILLLITKAKLVHATALKGIFFNLHIFIFILGFISMIVIVIFSRKHLGIGPTHTLLFNLPIFLLLVAFFVKHLLMNKITFLLGVFLLILYTQSNFSTIIQIAWNWKGPTFNDQYLLAKYLESHGQQGFSLDIAEPIITHSLMWVINNYTTNLDKKVDLSNTKSSNKYLVANLFSNHPGKTNCARKVFLKSFGSLVIYKCDG